MKIYEPEQAKQIAERQKNIRTAREIRRFETRKRIEDIETQKDLRNMVEIQYLELEE